MIKAFLLCCNPSEGWNRIAQARHGFFYIVTTYLLPVILLGTVVECWGLEHWGKWQPRYEFIRKFSTSTVITIGVVQTVLLLGMVVVSALLLLKISQTFHNRGTYLQAFTMMAYGYGPLFLTRLLDAAPSINPWVSWGIGIGLTIWILYQGIPRVMQPDPTHAFGLYLSAIFVAVLTSGIVRVFTALYLLGVVNLQHSWLGQTFPGLTQ